MDAGAKFVLIAPILPVVVLGVLFAHGPWTPLRVAGLLIALLSFGLLSLARVHLGNSFSVMPEAKQLVRRGIYSKVRHPVYVFGLLALLGMILYVNKPWFLLLFVVLVPVQIARARAEEKVLEQQFGEEYTNYKKSTWL